MLKSNAHLIAIRNEPITDTGSLAKFCDAASSARFLTVDTEFIRETTFWPRLCLIQLATNEEAVTVDPLADGLDLQPFFELMGNPSVVKVFHAARQDIEIIHHLGGLIPAPIFDTQVAAMVCGYGDAISYDQLVYRITGEKIDKSSRFTDWARRPLSHKQLSYALADVTHLRDVYRSLSANLKEQGRDSWVSEEMAILTSVGTYEAKPEDAWKRLKLRVKKPKEIAVMITVAAWREREAQSRNVPRARIIRDDAIHELAAQQPKSTEDLKRMRALSRGFERSDMATPLLQAVSDGLKTDLDTVPKPDRGRPMPNGVGAITDMLKILLKAVSEKEGVAARVIATSDDLTKIAADDNADVAALSGWRRELFGNEALKLKSGELCLTVEQGRVVTITKGR
ncbi:MAG: ribonuclease D [Pseudomonadota bacterium]